MAVGVSLGRCHPSRQYTWGLRGLINAGYSEAVKADGEEGG